MKNKGLILTLIILLSVVAIAILVFLVLLLTGNTRLGYINFTHRVSEELVLEETYDSTFNTILINAFVADIDVKTSSDEQIKVFVYGDKERTNVDTSNGKLTITTKGKKCFGICFNQKIDKVEVYIPSTFDKELEVNNDYGNVVIDAFLNSNMTVTEKCGDVSIQGGNEVKVNNSFGDIRIKEANKVHVKESAGDVTVGKVNDAVIHNNYGDIEVSEVTNYMDIKQDCGDVNIDRAVLNKDSKIVNHLGDIEIGFTNEIYIDAKTSLGDVKVRQNNHNADIILKIENSCGDIEVDN